MIYLKNLGFVKSCGDDGISRARQWGHSRARSVSPLRSPRSPGNVVDIRQFQNL